ncbi:basic blue protein-like [Carica papaya]|uniref:basic blue protein-like n=1 Tax=Carica papaya TaxID=3649 RepID=UPI000B8CC099|nr:basic blue protein-like [Carica papaya]
MLIGGAISAPKTWIVGDEYGWDTIINVEQWPEGKHFYAGDILVFNYDYQDSNVVKLLNKTGYDTCTKPEGAEEYESGNDKIPLDFGLNHFISGYPVQCQAGLKMFINATAPPN